MLKAILGLYRFIGFAEGDTLLVYGRDDLGCGHDDVLLASTLSAHDHMSPTIKMSGIALEISYLALHQSTSASCF